LIIVSQLNPVIKKSKASRVPRFGAYSLKFGAAHTAPLPEFRRHSDAPGFLGRRPGPDIPDNLKMW
jgi:hypothetical protein